jgi:Spy/CpxP family protein refolding chaperone
MRIVVIVWMMSGLTLFGQQGSRSLYPWWESPMVRDLHLSEDQARQIRTTLREQRGQLIDLRAAVEKAEGDVEDVFNEESIDQKRAGETIEKLVRARTELTRAYAMVSVKLRAVLTAQQWRELQRRRPQPPPAPQPVPGPARLDQPMPPPQPPAPRPRAIPPEPPRAPQPPANADPVLP